MQITIEKFSPEKIPTAAGLYFFKDRENAILYVGKAANLRARVRSYFSETQTRKVELMLRESRKLEVMPLHSEIEALIKEAAFIKRHRPKYNILLRDDKNYFFVGFTKERFPRIFITHQPRRFRNSRILGPFVSGRALKATLRLLRKTFPYCICRRPHRRICLQAQLGLCPGFCCRIGSRASVGDIRRYRCTIAGIRRILSGRSRALDQELRIKLATLTKRKKFEEAAVVRDQLRGLERVLEHRGLLVSSGTKAYIALSESGNMRQFARTLGSITPLHRIEFYDASVLSGTNAVGGMTAWRNGKADKSAWRLFRIRKAGMPGDPAAIAEMLERRLAHREWKLPNLIVVDGGPAQYNAVRRAVRRANLEIPVAAVAKGKPRHDRLLCGEPPRMIPFTELPYGTRNFLTRMRDATHRFALGYQRRRRKPPLAQNKSKG